MMGTKKYILDERGEPKQCDDVLKWGAWYETGDRRVKMDIVGDYCISTIFLGLDYGWGWKDRPIIWETMVFKGEESLWFDRCGGSREQAEAMHAKMIEQVKEENRKLSNNCARLAHML